MASIASRRLRIARRSAHALAVAASLVALPAARAEDSALLTKADVESTFVGKTLKYTKASDNETTAYDVRDGGTVYHVANTMTRAVTVKGAWNITDDGQLCFVWNNTDKYVTLKDFCLKFRRTGDKLQVVGTRNTDRVVGDVVQ